MSGPSSLTQLAVGLQAVPLINSGWLYAGLAALCLLLALVALLLPGWLRRRRLSRPAPVSRHSLKRAPEHWRETVRHTVEAYQAGRLDEADAYSHLARIARTFASERLGTDLRSKTLLDLGRHRQVSDKAHFDSLKQTISALYPAEFAEPSSNEQARQSTVETAADWVDRLIERWTA